MGNWKDNTLYGYYIDQAENLIYKKFDNSQNNTIPYNYRKYYAGYFCNIKNLVKN